MGGRVAEKGSWPWQVLILNREGTSLCGQMLLSKKWILTVAHCAHNGLYARAGEYDLTEV
ncbi:Ovochymase-2, partial [Stegodyphus mimosarum]